MVWPWGMHRSSQMGRPHRARCCSWHRGLGLPGLAGYPTRVTGKRDRPGRRCSLALPCRAGGWCGCDPVAKTTAPARWLLLEPQPVLRTKPSPQLRELHHTRLLSLNSELCTQLVSLFTMPFCPVSCQCTDQSFPRPQPPPTPINAEHRMEGRFYLGVNSS